MGRVGECDVMRVGRKVSNVEQSGAARSGPAIISSASTVNRLLYSLHFTRNTFYLVFWAFQHLTLNLSQIAVEKIQTIPNLFIDHPTLTCNISALAVTPTGFDCE